MSSLSVQAGGVRRRQREAMTRRRHQIIGELQRPHQALGGVTRRSQHVVADLVGEDPAEHAPEHALTQRRRPPPAERGDRDGAGGEVFDVADVQRDRRQRCAVGREGDRAEGARQPRVAAACLVSIATTVRTAAQWPAPSARSTSTAYGAHRPAASATAARMIPEEMPRVGGIARATCSSSAMTMSAC